MGKEQKSKSQATILVELADETEVFHDADKNGFAIVCEGKHRETYKIRSKQFKHWLARSYYEQLGTAPGTQAVQDALGTIKGNALFNGPTRHVNLRIGGDESRLLIDLGANHWERILVTSKGWVYDTSNDLVFVRSRGMLPLPHPRKSSEGLELLRRFLNVRDEELPLLVGWLIGALCPQGPYPLLAIHGEQGSAKSTTSKVCRRLIDPNKADLRSAPREERDLVITASNSWILALENLSSISGWLSDSLCRIATGSGFATRELYSNGDEAIFSVQRPILLNGIEELATRSDLIDRSLFLSLPRITEHQRKTEAEFWAEFRQVHGHIFGWLLDCIVAAFRNLSQTELESLPRMADFAKWVCASETSIGWDGKRFLDAYMGNRQDANETAIEASVVGKPIVEYMQEHTSFEGTSTELLNALNSHADNETNHQRQQAKSGWPKSGRGISGQLRRLAPNFRKLGIDVELDLPGRLLRLGMRSTVPTVSTVEPPSNNAKGCDESPTSALRSNGSSGQMRTQSKEVICDCGNVMVANEFVIDGWQNWDCAKCESVKPIRRETPEVDEARL